MPELIEAIFKASAWAEAHPEETRRFVARESGATEEQVLAANGPDIHRHLGLGLEPDLIGAVEHYKNFLRDFGFLAGDFDIGEWVDRRHLDGFAERAVA